MQFKQIVLLAAALLPFASGVVGAPTPVVGELHAFPVALTSTPLTNWYCHSCCR